VIKRLIGPLFNLLAITSDWFLLYQ